MSVVSVRRAAARRCRCVGAAACAPVASASGAAGKAGRRGALSLSGGGLEREGCIQAASDEGYGAPLTREGPWQATSFEPWQSMVVRHCGSGTGCITVQWMMGGSCASSGRLQRACPWHQRCFSFFVFWVEESLHVHRCQSYQQPERQIQQTTGECRVHSTFYDKGSCFAMA